MNILNEGYVTSKRAKLHGRGRGEGSTRRRRSRRCATGRPRRGVFPLHPFLSLRYSNRSVTRCPTMYPAPPSTKNQMTCTRGLWRASA